MKKMVEIKKMNEEKKESVITYKRNRFTLDKQSSLALLIAGIFLSITLIFMIINLPSDSPLIFVLFGVAGGAFALAMYSLIQFDKYRFKTRLTMRISLISIITAMITVLAYISIALGLNFGLIQFRFGDLLFVSALGIEGVISVILSTITTNIMSPFFLFDLLIIPLTSPLMMIPYLTYYYADSKRYSRVWRAVFFFIGQAINMIILCLYLTWMICGIIFDWSELFMMNYLILLACNVGMTVFASIPIFFVYEKMYLKIAVRNTQ